MQGAVGAVFVGLTATLALGTDGGSMPTELLEDEEDCNLEIIDKLSTEDFLFDEIDLLFVSKVCDEILPSKVKESEYGVGIVPDASALTDGINQI